MSDGFSADWLALREPYDATARSAALLERLVVWRHGRGVLRVIDLGAGTGSNLRHTASTLGGDQDWALAELDPTLIAAGQARLARSPVDWRYHQIDLARDLERLGALPVDLITASALIDLVGEAWLRRLAALRAAANAALHIVLTYDGRIEWQPKLDGDEAMLAAINRHQRGDKGFGPALGPDAAATLRALLVGERGELLVEPSDWLLGEDDREIQLALLDGYTTAAISVSAERCQEIKAWAVRRRKLIGEGRSRLRVGHLDLLFLPER